ncbi:MAG: MFS transporter [Patescibacteria group bacterium]
MFHLDYFRKHHYIGEKLNKNLVALYVSQLIHMMAIEMLFLYGPIFIFLTFNRSYNPVFYYYLIGFALYALLLPVGAKIMSRLGLKAAMLLSKPVVVLYMVSFYFFHSAPMYFFFITIVLLTIYRLLYWAPYHTELAEFTDRISRGRELALLRVMLMVMKTITPITAGFIISLFSFEAMFFTAAIIAFLAFIPLLFVSPVREEYSYGYLESFRKILKWSNRKLVISHIALGATEVTEIVIWPVFIFVILGGSILSVGAVSSLVILVLVIISLIMGAMTDKHSKERMMRFGIIFLSSGWILRGLASNLAQIFLTHTYYNLGNAFFITPFQALYYERAADRGHYVDEYTVIKEISLNIGKVLMLAALFILVPFFGMTGVFIAAGIISIFIAIF